MRVRDEQNDDDSISDNRRARLADLQRLEAALSEATGQLKAMQFYMMSVLSGRNIKHLRNLADAAWESYIGAMDGKPAPTLQEIYGPAAQPADAAQA